MGTVHELLIDASPSRPPPQNPGVGAPSNRLGIGNNVRFLGRGGRFAGVGDGRHFQALLQVRALFLRGAVGWLGRPGLPPGISMHSPTFARAQ
ncbi:hypothetical protein FRX94_08660 [Corynebacterium canis]|uniref:Uncharacterized protein n=1 Tax=Corynebacterium canis TaxID=679663 RepID=A0A5C5UFH2_9CORY|nr:hypothetical protein [Corynebacterium canis]TWT24220.1 hypothetical protein FRX94_08660 [Corynebacterium canis]